MNRNILKSDSSFMIIGRSPAWITGDYNNAYYESGRVFSLTQAVNFDFSSTRQGYKQLGYQHYSSNIQYKAPEVNLSVDYYLSPYLHNELLMGFSMSGLSGKTAISSIKNNNNNFYLFFNKDDTAEGFGQIGKTPINTQDWQDYETICFGNCYLSSYSLSFSLGEIPKVATKFKSSNISAESFKTGVINSLPSPYVQVPALNPSNGELDYNAKFWYPYTSVTGGNITEGSQLKNDLNLPVALSEKAFISITNKTRNSSNVSPLRNFDSLALQSCNLNLNFNRVDLYKLGNNSVCDRKLQFPINAQIQIESLVSGFNSTPQNTPLNNSSAILNNQEEVYDIDLSFSNRREYVTGFYNFKEAKLNSLNYQSQVNNIYKMSASFSVEITEQTGFYMNVIQK